MGGQCNIDVATGCALAKFLNEVDMVETEIGDVKSCDGSSIQGTPRYLVVTGGILVKGSSLCNVLKDASSKIVINSKFKSIEDKSALRILKDYLKEASYSENVSEELCERLRNIESNKYIVSPFKISSHCKASGIDGMAGKADMVIHGARWDTDSNGEMQHLVLMNGIGFTSEKIYKTPITEYGKSLVLSDIDRMNTNPDSWECIEMTQYSFIRPVRVIVDGKTNLVCDNTFLYKEDIAAGGDTKVTPVAYWDSNNKLVWGEEGAKLQRSKVYKQFKVYEDMVSKHRRFIAPYRLVDCKEVK